MVTDPTARQRKLRRYRFMFKATLAEIAVSIAIRADAGAAGGTTETTGTYTGTADQMAALVIVFTVTGAVPKTASDSGSGSEGAATRRGSQRGTAAK